MRYTHGDPLDIIEMKILEENWETHGIRGNIFKNLKLVENIQNNEANLETEFTIVDVKSEFGITKMLFRNSLKQFSFEVFLVSLPGVIFHL